MLCMASVLIFKALGMIMNANNPKYKGEKLSNMTVLGSRAATNFPFIGPLFNFWGIEGCDSQNLKKLMS